MKIVVAAANVWSAISPFMNVVLFSSSRGSGVGNSGIRNSGCSRSEYLEGPVVVVVGAVSAEVAVVVLVVPVGGGGVVV